MDANPARHILVNTMRASFPTQVEGTSYRMMIENEKQREEMEAAMQYLLPYLRHTLGNDMLTLSIEINQGEASPHTWNERQVLNHMVGNTPLLGEMIDDFGLTIG